MTDAQRDLLLKARTSLDAARLLYSAGFSAFAASRAYYAMFYVAQAFLEGDGLTFSRHAGVISAFGQHFARTGRVPVELHRYLLEAMAVRHQGDYALHPAISANDAAEQITRAEQLLEAVLKFPHPVDSSNLSRTLELPNGRKNSSYT
jgi:uncharacterized protein (UPF0332 family)